ncbi:MAG: phage holin family protein [Cloacibacillus porcorum]|uniref:phage holin family protein n=1 Tax=Cloacibacillus porcorum TaxID=1197717 RepID=UPI0023F2A75F|nr:phage holin family protein [Cloacibacillus porcorum]MCD7876039.1 phage holin family protein [Cloacibacillus porcorum]
MNRLTELVISFFELVEAEGRELREQAQGVLRGAAMFFFGGALLSAGVLTAVYALYLTLASRLGRPAAALIAALLLGAVGAALILKSRPSAKGGEAQNDDES